MRFAYADPPYPGMAHLYKDHPDYAGEVDHQKLIERLVAEFPDGWALSTNEKSLQFVLSLCPPLVRILAWCKPQPHPMSVQIQYSWEPVIVKGGRRNLKDFSIPSFMVNRQIDTGATHWERVFVGQKPAPFCFWLFRCLGAGTDDELIDLFPGSGAVGRAWDKFQRQMTLPMEREKGKQTRFGEEARETPELAATLPR